MANDLTKAPLQILIDQINADNAGVTLLSSEVTVAAPAVETGATNTSIVFSAIEPTSRFTGNQTFFYNRLNLGTVLNAGNKDFEFETALDTLAELIAAINTRYGINLTTDDYTSDNFPVVGAEPGETHAVNITAKAGSLIFIGAGSVNVVRTVVPLADALPVNTLNGLTYSYPA
jgi:hypothetical protein